VLYQPSKPLPILHTAKMVQVETDTLDARMLSLVCICCSSPLFVEFHSSTPGQAFATALPLSAHLNVG